MSPKPNASDRPVPGCIADDVTGATDLAINLVSGGFRVVQILPFDGPCCPLSLMEDSS